MNDRRFERERWLELIKRKRGKDISFARKIWRVHCQIRPQLNFQKLLLSEFHGVARPMKDFNELIKSMVTEEEEEGRPQEEMVSKRKRDLYLDDENASRWQGPFFHPLYLPFSSFFFPGRLRGGPHGVNHPCQDVDLVEHLPESHPAAALLPLLGWLSLCPASLFICLSIPWSPDSRLLLLPSLSICFSLSPSPYIYIYIYI